MGLAKLQVGEKTRSAHLQVVPTKKSKILKCFLCDGSHEVRVCPQKAALTALQALVQEEQGVDSKRHDEVPEGTRVGNRAGSSRSHGTRG